MEKLAVVLTRNYSTALSVVRALGSTGYTVDLIISCEKPSDAKIVACSKFVRRCSVVLGKKNAAATEENVLRLLRDYIGQEYDEPIVLFPTDDYSAMLVDEYGDDLRRYFAMPYIVGGGAGSIALHMDKSTQTAIAERAGMLAPKGWKIDLAAPYIPEDMIYPCFVKPLQSTSGYKTEMKACANKTELASHLAYLKNRNSDRSIFIQEFLTIDSEISMSGVCIDQEIILPGLVKKSYVAKFEKGVTLAGCLVPANYLGDDVERQIKAVLREFHYVGMFDMEVLLCGDKVYFGEVNLRSGGPNFAYTLNGTNLPQVAVHAILGKERLPEKEVLNAFGRPFVYEKVAWEDYMNFCMKKDELDFLLSESEDRLLHWDEDPAPGVEFNRQMEAGKGKGRFIGLLKKTFIYSTYKWVKQLGSFMRFNNFMKIKRLTTAKDVLEAKKPTSGKNGKRVIIISRNYSSILTMVRSLAGLGYEIEVLRTFEKTPKFTELFTRMNPEGYSKYVSKYSVLVTNHNPRKLVSKLIEMYNPDRRTLLIPADDIPMSVIDSYYDRLSQYYLLPNISGKQGMANYFMEKNRQKSLARAFGFNVVDSHEIQITEGMYQIPDEINYPCFLKPAVSTTSSKSIMRRCNNRSELNAALNELASDEKNIGLIVEDFLEITNEYALLGFCAKESVALSDGMIHFLESGQGGRIGVCMMGEVVSTDSMLDLVSRVRSFMKSLDFEGLFDIDLLEANGKIYFCELNLRFGASGYAITKSGVNLPAMMADYMFDGKEVDEAAVLACTGYKFVSEKILVECYGDKLISKHKMNDCIEKADIHFIDDENDPGPYNYFQSISRLARSAYVLKLIKKRSANG